MLLDSLDRYSLCEKHYNQIIVNDSIVLDLEKTERKRPRLSNDNDLLQFGKTYP